MWRETSPENLFSLELDPKRLVVSSRTSILILRQFFNLSPLQLTHTVFVVDVIGDGSLACRPSVRPSPSPPTEQLANHNQFITFSPLFSFTNSATSKPQSI